MKPLANVPASIHEALPQKFVVADQDDSVINELVSATKEARLVAEEARAMTEAVFRNGMLSEAMRQKTARDAGFKIMEKATRRIDNARAAAQRTLAAIEEKTSGPKAPRDATATLLASETRAVLRSMPEAKRREAIANAIRDNDAEVLGAFFSGSELLTGAGKAERAALRAQWARAHFAADLERAQRIGGALQHLDRAGALLIGFISDLTDQTEIERAVESARKADELVRRAAPAAA